MPAPYLLTAILLTAATVHLGWLTQFAVPRGIADGTTILLGVLIGVILSDLKLADVARHGGRG